MSVDIAVPGTRPLSQLGKLGFLYATNPLQHSVSGPSVLGGAYLGSVLYESAGFGSIRTSDPDPRSARGEPGEQVAIQPWAEAAALEQTGGIGTHASK